MTTGETLVTKGARPPSLVFLPVSVQPCGGCAGVWCTYVAPGKLCTKSQLAYGQEGGAENRYRITWGRGTTRGQASWGQEGV